MGIRIMYMCSIWTLNKSQYLVVWSEYDKNSKYMVNLNTDINGALALPVVYFDQRLGGTLITSQVYNLFQDLWNRLIILEGG